MIADLGSTIAARLQKVVEIFIFSSRPWSRAHRITGMMNNWRFQSHLAKCVHLRQDLRSSYLKGFQQCTACSASVICVDNKTGYRSALYCFLVFSMRQTLSMEFQIFQHNFFYVVILRGRPRFMDQSWFWWLLPTIACDIFHHFKLLQTPARMHVDCGLKPTKIGEKYVKIYQQV